MNNSELTDTQKLQLSERANEVYRQQLKYMQDHLASLRSLILHKENVISNLMLRYDLGIITQDQHRQNCNLSMDEIEMDELYRKTQALSQKTILENFELREMINKLRDENYHLRNAMHEHKQKNITLDEFESVEPVKKRRGSYITGDEVASYQLHETRTQNSQSVPNIFIDDVIISVDHVVDEKKDDQQVTNDNNIIEMEDIDDRSDRSSTPVVNLGFEDPDVLLHYEKLKNMDLELELKRLTENNYFVSKETMQLLFGVSLYEVIPSGLNERALSKFKKIFDGFYHETCKDSKGVSEFVMIPADINALISCYYPIFVENYNNKYI